MSVAADVSIVHSVAMASATTVSGKVSDARSKV